MTLLPSGGQPAFAPVADKLGRNCQFTNQDGFISLEARSRGHIHGQNLFARNTILVAFRATPPPWTAALANLLLRNLVHARRFERRPRRQVLQPRDLIAQILVLGLQSSTSHFGLFELVS